jgi:hypothetical protein
MLVCSLRQDTSQRAIWRLLGDGPADPDLAPFATDVIALDEPP